MARMIRVSSQKTGFFRRFAAITYDTCVLIPLLFAATCIAILLHHQRAFAPENHFFQAYILLCLLTFFAWSWKKRGQTLGMMAWQIAIRDAYHRPLTWTQACVRFLCILITMACFGLGWWWSIFDSEHLPLYDRLSKTYLFKCEKH